MSYIGIGSPIPDISSLPGQTGGEVEVNLNYPSAAVCSNGSDQTPSVKSPNGGTFSSTPSGLSINSSSGVIDVSESTPNNYTISYTVEGVVSSFAFTINQLEQSTFSYSASSFQQIGTATPTLASGTTAGGTFSASTGVVINTSTGVIDLAASTIGGPYTITYTTPGTCFTSSTFTLSITAVSVEIIDNDFAMEFDGASDYIELPNSTSLQATTNLTLSCWIKVSDVSTTNSIIDKFFDGADRSYLLRLQSSRIRFYLAIADGSNSNYYQSSATFNNNTWYHIVATFDSSGAANKQVKIYVNGSLDSEHGKTDLISTNVMNPRIGAGYGNPAANYFGGDIDEVAIWNRTLELTDVQRIYNATANNPGKTANLFTAGLNTGLVLWNRMGD